MIETSITDVLIGVVLGLIMLCFLMGLAITLEEAANRRSKGDDDKK